MEISLLMLAYPLVLLIISFLFAFYLIKGLNGRIRSVETQLDSSEFVVNELKGMNDRLLLELKNKEEKQKEWQVEQRQVTQQLEHRIKVLQEQYEQATNELLQLSQQQPEDKLYQRAQKMVSLGAGIEEIMQECDLPHAEAELLVSMHQRSSTK